MWMYVFAPLSASVGQYCVTVRATDPATNVSVSAAVPIHISACTPQTHAGQAAAVPFRMGAEGQSSVVREAPGKSCVSQSIEAMACGCWKR